MGWHKRPSGWRYDSSSGHTFIIGGRSKGIIGMVLYSKAFRKCGAADKIGEETEEHYFPKNFEGSSKIMEASAIMKMVEDVFYNRFFIIDAIFSDDDITMRAVLKNASKVAQCRVQLDEDIPEPSFLENTSHCVKVVAIFFHSQRK